MVAFIITGGRIAPEQAVGLDHNRWSAWIITRGRLHRNTHWRDNVFIERLWKSVKYEDVYLKAYNSIAEVRKGLTAWFDRYNKERRHQGLDDRTPDEVYWGTLPGVKNAM